MAKGKRSTTPAPANETKEERFVRLATMRVNKILKGIEGLGKLSGSNYAYTPDQVHKIFEALSNCSQEQYAKFSNRGGPAAQRFML